MFYFEMHNLSGTAKLPGILQYAEMSDIIGLIAPRPLLFESGIEDPIFPIDGVETAYFTIKKVYATLNQTDHLFWDTFSGSHEIKGTHAYQWLKNHLKKTPDKCMIYQVLFNVK